MKTIKNLKALFQSPGIDDRKKHYYWVDALRALAALMVLLWHYQHLYYPSAGINPMRGMRHVQPFYEYLWLFYDHGHYAVQLFWVISGFVLAAVYVNTTSTARNFFVNRFARLYPLHLLTLIAVACLQALGQEATGHYQIYADNGVRNFILNILFISHWGFEKGMGFNAPIWSVSVELAAYIAFWLTIRRLFRFGILGPALMASGIIGLLYLRLPGMFWDCGIYFFLGTAVFIFLNSFRDQGLVPLAIGLLGFSAGCAVCLRSESSNFGLLMFPMLVLIAGAVDTLDKNSAGRKLGPFGDLTYGIYLWQVPVQISLILALDSFGFDRVRIASNWYFLVFFVAAVVGMARLSFVYYERPMRRVLRERLTSYRRHAAVFPA